MQQLWLFFCLKCLLKYFQNIFSLRFISKYNFNDFCILLGLYDILNNNGSGVYNQQNPTLEMYVQNVMPACFNLYVVLTYRIYLTITVYSSISSLLTRRTGMHVMLSLSGFRFPSIYYFPSLISLTFPRGYNFPIIFSDLK